MEFWKMRMSFLIILLMVIVSPALSQSESTIETFKTDQKLQSWGRVGGITIDRIGFIYISNFGNSVWKVSPTRDVELLTSSLYGASGNVVDSDGNLLQASFYDNTIYMISRDGKMEEYVNSGLILPVGLTFDAKGNLYVCNCGGGYISKISPEKESEIFAREKCSNAPMESLQIRTIIFMWPTLVLMIL